jgi:hypothetical protein
VTARIAEDDGVLPTWLLVPTLGVAAWAAVAPFALTDASSGDVVACFTVPGAVVAGFALADWAVWRRRRRPWHDWTVIVLLLPAIAAAVWLTLGGIVEGLALTRAELLGLEVGPGMALVGLLATTVSYHGRHHPDERL